MTDRSIMEDTDRAKFERGCEMLKRLQDGKGFEDHWVPVGDGLLAIRRTVMAVLRLTKARGGLYNDAFSRWCAGTAYADMEKVDRSNLLYCMENLATIVEMRASWSPTQRAKINHPTTMKTHLKEFLNRAPTEAAPRRNASPMALLRERKEQLERDKLELEEKVASLEARAEDGSLFDLDRSPADGIARVIVDQLSRRRSGRDKAKKIAELILERLAQRPSSPAG